MKRRQFLRTTAAAAAAAAAASNAPRLGAQNTSESWIDTNVYLHPWPFRSLPDGDPETLAAALRDRGVTHAWTGSFDALLHRDLDSVNVRLVKTCRESAGGGFFLPFGAVDPSAPGWRETLRRCHEEHGMPGIRLHPNYHGYALDDPALRELLAGAGERNLIVQIAVRMEDERTQHPLVAVPDLDVEPLVQTLSSLRGARVQLLNATRTTRNPLLLQRLAKLRVLFEIAMLEGMEGVRTFLDENPSAKLAFGSYTPFFYPDAAFLKLRESKLTETELASLRSVNATSLLPP